MSDVIKSGSSMPYCATIKSVLDDRVLFFGTDYCEYANVLSSCVHLGYSILITYEKVEKSS